MYNLCQKLCMIWYHLLKLTLLHGCFFKSTLPHILNCTSDTKLRKGWHVIRSNQSPTYSANEICIWMWNLIITLQVVISLSNIFSEKSIQEDLKALNLFHTPNNNNSGPDCFHLAANAKMHQTKSYLKHPLWKLLPLLLLILYWVFHCWILVASFLTALV